MTKSRTKHGVIPTLVKRAQRVSVPIVAVNTPDPAATIKGICDAITTNHPKVQWDMVRGYLGLNELGCNWIKDNLGEENVKYPEPALTVAQRLPEGAILFIHLANECLRDAGVVQATWNLRDQFKRDHRLLVLLSPSLTLCEALAGDVMQFDEPLPDEATLTQIVKSIHTAASVECDEAVTTKAVEALTGLSAFQAEQVTAMSMQKSGLELPELWQRKYRTIEQTPGLKVCSDGGTLDSIGGVQVIKDFIRRIVTGKARPNAIVFIDEIEKMIGGAGTDSSGVSQDQLGQLLSYMQDHGAAGMIFIGPPGAAKSAVAKAAGNEAGIPTIQLDLGGAKGSLVGQSEHNLRQALKVITSVSNGRSLWIATCNSIGNLPPELRRRFTLGTFFFDLPDRCERDTIWQLYFKKYQAQGVAREGNDFALVDNAWTGAEIRQCFDLAWRLGCTLTEASQFIVPVARSAGDQIERLRTQADGRFLSASYPGPYKRAGEQAAVDPNGGGRKLQFDEG